MATSLIFVICKQIQHVRIIVNKKKYIECWITKLYPSFERNSRYQNRIYELLKAIYVKYNRITLKARHSHRVSFCLLIFHWFSSHEQPSVPCNDYILKLWLHISLTLNLLSQISNLSGFFGWSLFKLFEDNESLFYYYYYNRWIYPTKN